MDAVAICRKLDSLSAADATLDELFFAAVEEIHQASDRFHWTGIYELIEENTLRLGPFIGPPSDHVFIFRNRAIKKDLIRDRIKAAGKRVGVKVSPHRLRHTPASPS